MTETNGRCVWAEGCPETRRYHDERWCVPLHDERELFAMLILEGQQAGLSWTLILKREAAIREALWGLDPAELAAKTPEELEPLMQNAAIIRNRAKLRAAVTNARAFLRVQAEFGSFDRYIWGFTDGKTVVHHLKDGDALPASDELSERVSADLKRRGFRFCGPVIVYSYLQAAGIIDDHLDSCPWKRRSQDGD